MMLRRAFLQTAIAPLLSSTWRSAPPASRLREIENEMRSAGVPGAVLGALHNAKLSWIVPLGLQQSGVDQPVMPETLFHAASLSKQVTAHAAFALRAQGKLDFEKPLADYVDDLRTPEARRVTARHVLSHSSGFPNWRYADGSGSAPDLTPAFLPGSRYRYSGEGYFYLQRVMEFVADVGFEQVISDLVFKPLGMTSSTFLWDPATTARTAKAHGRNGQIGKEGDRAAAALRRYAASASKPPAQLKYAEYAPLFASGDGPPLPNGMRPNAASSLVTSAEDYAHFLAGAIRNPDLSKQQVAINPSLGWGLGWAIERAEGHTYLWQWGDNPGFKNFVLAEPSTESALFIFTNGDNGKRIYERAVTGATGHNHPALEWL